MAGGEAGRPPSAGPKSELGARVVSSIVLAVAVLGATYLGGFAFAFVWAIAAIAIASEWLTMTGVQPRRILLPLAGTVLGLMALSAWFPGTPRWITPAIGLAGFGAIVALAADARDRLWAASGLVYAAVILLVPPLVREHPMLGITGIVWMFAVVWFSDIAAYFTGRALGGPKLMPSVSPKKTWSGFLGGVAAATLVGTLVAYVAMAASVATGYAETASRVALPLSLSEIALLSALAAVFGQAGDLAESAMKRHSGVKDSGHLIPGHGGFMDRLDAFWPVAALVGLALGLARMIEG